MNFQLIGIQARLQLYAMPSEVTRLLLTLQLVPMRHRTVSATVLETVKLSGLPVGKLWSFLDIVDGYGQKKAIYAPAFNCFQKKCAKLRTLLP